MDQSLVHVNFLGKFVWTNSPESLLKFPPALVLVHGWLFPAFFSTMASEGAPNHVNIPIWQHSLIFKGAWRHNKNVF